MSLPRPAQCLEECPCDAGRDLELLEKMSSGLQLGTIESYTSPVEADDLERRPSKETLPRKALSYIYQQNVLGMDLFTWARPDLRNVAS
jgi:hypothetical protein